MICRICQREYQPQHFNQRLCSFECKREAARERNRKYRSTEKGRLAELKWRDNPKKKISDKRYRESEKGLIKARIRAKEFRKRNPEYVKKVAEIQKKEKRWLTEEYRIKNKVSKKKYRQTIKGKVANKNAKVKRRSYLVNVGKFTKGEWEKKLREFNHRCAYCENNVKLEVDHIKPISKGGMNTIDNIQPLCRSCNSKKSNKYE